MLTTFSPSWLAGRRASHHSDVPCSQHGEPCPLEAVFNTGQPVQVMHIHYDPLGREEYVQLQAAPILGEDGEVLYMGEYINVLPAPDESQPILVGRSPVFLQLIGLLQRVAPTSSTVLLLGESGVGKEKVAQYIRHYSRRQEQPFVVLDCATLGEQLIESELFGYEKGAFTGANRRKQGLFEVAHGGTLFIDEIGELPLSMQTRLLRVLESGTIRRLGGSEYIPVDVRIIAATNRDLWHQVEQGLFRRDLYYRLSAFPVRIPPLRQRRDDIPALAEYFLARFPEGEKHLPLSSEVIGKLLSHEYPGNVRELRNVLERATILACDGALMPDHIVLDADQPLEMVAAQPEAGLCDGQTLPGAGRQKLTVGKVMQALEQTGGHRGRAAALLGVSERTLYRYLRRMRQGGG